MKVQIDYYKDTGKWQGSFSYKSNLQTYQTNEIIEECKTKYSILERYNFVFSAFSKDGDITIWNSHLVLKAL